MRSIARRLEALERAADKEAITATLTYAVAYHLGGAKHMSEFFDAYARALGYPNLSEFCRGLEDLLQQPSDSVDEPLGIRQRALRARCALLAKFGYDPLLASPAALADPSYRIFKTLPENGVLRSDPRTGDLACTRFRRHRVRCFDGAGGGPWRDGSLRESSSLRLCA